MDLSVVAQFMNFEGGIIRYLRGGENGGVPILLTSPWPESILAFHPIWPALIKLGPVVAVDLPGFGRSDFRDELMSPSAMGSFLVRLAKAFGLARIHGVGPDVGTSAMLFAAREMPELFESVVVGSGGTSMDLIGEGLRRIITKPEDEIDGGRDGEIVGARIPTLLRSPPSVEQLDDYRKSSAGGRYRLAARYVRAYPRDLSRLHKLLPEIMTPTLVISGKHDPIVPPENGELLKRLLPHCRTEIVDSGHFVWEDTPDIYADLLKQWISGAYRSA
jgi:pimeloyl-ACP methyl ester carboxylesterase